MTEGWIACAERLPELRLVGSVRESDEVLVALHGHVQIASLEQWEGTTDGSVGDAMVWRGAEDMELSDVTHWQPLPEPPA